jgi:hypothetical protein
MNVFFLVSLLVASCSFSAGFHLKSIRSRFHKSTKCMASSDDSAPKIPMTISEKEKDFQKTLDNLLVEARSNNALLGKAEGGEFSVEDMAVAAEEMKKLKTYNSEIKADSTVSESALNLKLKSFEIAQPDSSNVQSSGGFGKKLAIFGALTIVFAAILLPIIDKIFPDPPSIENSISSK